MAGLILQGPYIYQRYLDSGIDPANINIIMSIYNIAVSFWGFLVGHAIDRLGHKKLMILSVCILSLHSTLRYVGGFFFFIVASALLGVSLASNEVAFEDWLMTELQSFEAPGSSIVTVQENSTVIRLLITLALTPVTAKLTHEFGSNAVFSISALLFFTSAFVILIGMKNHKGTDSKRQKVRYTEALKSVFEAVRTSRELTVMLLIDVCYNVFCMLYSPRWLSLHQLDKKERLPLSQMSSTVSLALMNGAQISGTILQVAAPRNVLFVGFLVYTCTIATVLTVFQNKNFVYGAYIFAINCDGGLEPVLRMSRGSIYPRHIRGYILGLLRVPNSLIVSGILLIVKSGSVTVIV
jgi:MFS family permease